jgi:hypothetical protein
MKRWRAGLWSHCHLEGLYRPVAGRQVEIPEALSDLSTGRRSSPSGRDETRVQAAKGKSSRCFGRSAAHTKGRGAEEPDAVKAARPVLERRRGERSPRRP